MIILQVNDQEWMIGETASACLDEYHAYFGLNQDFEDEAHALGDYELDTLIFVETDEDERPTGVKRTFREQMSVEISKGGEFPRLFASSAY